MSKKLYEETNLQAIANAIRGKLGGSDTYLPSEMAVAIASIITPNLQSKTVTPGASQQSVSPDTGYNGLSGVTVAGDADLVAENIKKDVNIFGVTGSYEGSGGGNPTLQSKSVTPGASQQTISPDNGYDGLSSVVVAGDADLVASNIKKNVNIFGVTGSYEGSGGGEIESATSFFMSSANDYDNPRAYLLPTTATMTIFVLVDAILEDTLTINDFIVTGGSISSVTRINNNVLQFECSLTSGASLFSIETTSSALKFSNLEYIAVCNLGNYFDPSIGSKNFMQTVIYDTWTDTNSLEISTLKRWFNKNGYLYSGETAIGAGGNIHVSSNSYIWIGTDGQNHHLDINQKDTAYYSVYYDERDYIDAGYVCKVRWEGAVPHNYGSINEIYEVYSFDDGGYMIYFEQMPSDTSGVCSMLGTPFVLTNGPYISFYYRNGSYTVSYEKYQYSNNPLYVVGPPKQITFANAKSLTSQNLEIFYTGSLDVGAFTLNLSGLFAFNNIASIVIQADSYIQIDTSNIEVGRRDCSITKLSAALLELTDLNVDCLKIIWTGKSVFNGTEDREWELYLFSNGDAMLHIVTMGNAGTNSFLGTSFTAADNSYVSFYKQSGGTYTAAYGQYDITNHVS